MELYMACDGKRLMWGELAEIEDEKDSRGLMETRRLKGKEERGRKEGELRKKGTKEIKKDVMGWTVVTRNKKQREEGDSDLRRRGRNENGAEGGVARKQSPEDPEYCEWKSSGRVRNVRGQDVKER